jgi:hypothetical protein
MSASRAMPRLAGMRSADMRRAEMPPATAATHATIRDLTTPPESPGPNSWPGWARSFLLRARGVVATSGSLRLPAGAGSREVRGSQAEVGQDGFARVKLAPQAARRTARTAPSLSRPWTAHRLGRARAGPRRPDNRSGVARRTARDRHPQPLMAFHATVRTAVAPHGPRCSANACRSAIGRPILKGDIELPSITTHLPVGESDLDHAIAFDKVPPAAFQSSGRVTDDMLRALKERSTARIAKSEDFTKVQKDIAQYQKRKSEKTISLVDSEFERQWTGGEGRGGRGEEARGGDGRPATHSRSGMQRGVGTCPHE